MFGAFAQIILEVIVDCLCVTIEEKKGMFKSDFFFQFRNKELLWDHLVTVAFSIHWVLFSFKTIPSSIFCTNYQDPCTCTNSFPAYKSSCISISSNSNSTKVGDKQSVPSFSLSTMEVLLYIVAAILVILTFILIYFYSVKVNQSKVIVSQAKSELEEERHRNRLLMDSATNNLMEKSSLRQIITTIESLCKGASPLHVKLLSSVIYALKKPQNINFVDVESVLKDGSADKIVNKWLEEQLIGHEVRKGNENPEKGNVILFDLSKTKKDNDSKKILYSPSVTNDDSNLTLQGLISWENFNIFDIKSKTPQYFVAWQAFTLLGTMEALNISRIQLQNILIFIEEHYSMSNYNAYVRYGEHHSLKSVELVDRITSSSAGLKVKEGMENQMKKVNEYHNNYHGGDVFQAVLSLSLTYKGYLINIYIFIYICYNIYINYIFLFLFFFNIDVGGDFTPLELFALLFASYIHDFNHPGVNTTYVINDWPASIISSTFGTEVKNI